MKWNLTTECLPPNGSICVVYIDINAPLGDWFSKMPDTDVDCNKNSFGMPVHPTFIKIYNIPLLVKIDHEKDNYTVNPRTFLKKSFWCCDELWLRFCNRPDIAEGIKDQSIEFSIIKDCSKWALVEPPEGN